MDQTTHTNVRHESTLLTIALNAQIRPQLQCKREKNTFTKYEFMTLIHHTTCMRESKSRHEIYQAQKRVTHRTLYERLTGIPQTINR